MGYGVGCVEEGEEQESEEVRRVELNTSAFVKHKNNMLSGLEVHFRVGARQPEWSAAHPSNWKHDTKRATNSDELASLLLVVGMGETKLPTARILRVGGADKG